ncbi:hypothetical protein Patl1_04018 [Pistacia atlantica]|uniref:Uncharacterized protein n=1 Tax=Pistacia atlantica TaxID=434234 RepID=A0ACC1BSZ2_9ROSI|nr:hypothetical protein Patl1_04018 [Pistacia atlantica]
MVLDAMEGFYGVGDKLKSVKDPDMLGIRRACVLLLEVLLGINVNIGKEVRDRAKSLAFEWRKRVNLRAENGLELLGFLHLVAAYGLGSEFDKKDLVDLSVVAAKYRQGILLCKAIDLGDGVQDLIQKLIDRGKQFLAVKYIFEFKLTERYPPVPLLKAYVSESKRLAKKLRKDGRNTLRSQITDLKPEYPKDILQKRAEVLEKLKADRKRPATTPAPKPQQQPRKPQQQPRNPQQSGNKRLRTTASIGHTAPAVTGANVTVPLFPQSHLQPVGLLPEHSAAYLSTPTRPYSLVGSTPPVAPYAGSPIGLYGLTGAQVGFPGNSNHAVSHLYSSESHMPSGYYDRSTAYGGYSLPPQYHPSYYPQ